MTKLPLPIYPQIKSNVVNNLKDALKYGQLVSC